MYVNIGVAMGNAHQRVKDVADDITGSPDEDGLLTSFTQYGLICSIGGGGRLAARR